MIHAVIKSVESVLRPEESVWWERFVKEVGFEPGVKEGRDIVPFTLALQWQNPISYIVEMSTSHRSIGYCWWNDSVVDIGRWSAWSACSVMCGAGTMSRHRWCPPGPPAACVSVQNDICVRQACRPGMYACCYCTV